MAELLRAPTEGYAEAIVVPPILAEHFELKHSRIIMMTSDQFFGLEKDNPHDHIRAARRWLEKEPPRSILTWEDLVSKFINEFFPPSRTTNLRNEISNFQQRFDESFHEAWDRYKDLLRACPHHDSQTYLCSKSTNKCCDHRHDRYFQATPPLASVKSVEEIFVTCGGAHPYYQCLATDGNTFSEFWDNIQGYISAPAVNYNQDNFGYRPSSVANQIRSPGFARPNVKNNQNRFSQPQRFNRGNNFNQDASYQALIQQNQVVPLKEDERVEETLTDSDLAEYTIKVPPHLIQKAKPPSQRNYVKMLTSLLSNKEKLLELANTPLNENFLAVILKKLLEKLRDPRKFLIPYGFSELKCKALADLGASINLMLSVWKKLGLPELISTRMTLELANRAICTPAGIARDVFVPVGKFTFPTDFVIIDYESDPRVPLILGRSFLRTARALIDVHGEEMILRDGDERLTLNMRHDTSSYSNRPQKESINMINIYDDSCEDYLEDLNPTSFSPDHLLKEFADELALIIFPPGNNDLLFDIESDHREIEYLLNHDPTKEMDSILKDSIDESNLADPNNNLVDTIPEMFTDEHTLDYSSPPLYDDFDDDPIELKSDNDNVYDDPFDSKEDKIKESKLLIDELDPPRSNDFLPSLEYDSFLFEDFFEVEALPSTDNKDKVFVRYT
nr:reverse transcriptase domain-containing protein [Tanacetum cinerariifolium]